MLNDIEKWKQKTAREINDLAYKCFLASYEAGWWHDRQGNPLLVPDDPTRGISRKPAHEFVIPAMLCLMHSEISEAMEGDRKDAMDDKLPHRPQLEVELADSVIRELDLAAALNLDIGGAIAEKMCFNKIRPDHQSANRRKAGGKKY